MPISCRKTARRVAIETDDEASHNKSLVASNKFYDNLLKQISMVYLGWDVYRWAVRQMRIQPERLGYTHAAKLERGECETFSVNSDMEGLL